MKLSALIKQERFRSLSQETMLNIIVTSSWIMHELGATMAPYGVTPAQYNVLRILRGSAPQTLSCSELGERLLDRTPDVTRLLNRLQRGGLIRRERAEHDRRIVEVGITEEGQALVEQMEEEMEAAEGRLMSHLSPEEKSQLTQLLERLRTDQTV